MLIDGKSLAEQIRSELRQEIIDKGLMPSLAIILVGDDPASHLYVKLKEKACAEVGIDFHKYLLAADASQEKLIETIDFLNKDEEVSAIVLQLPLPPHLNEDEAIAHIHIDKDADGFGPQNLKLFMNFEAQIIPGLPNGIYELIKSTNVPMENKKVLVIANSEVFSKPICNMMKYKGATAEYIQPDDSNLKSKSLEADVIIIAVGRKWFLKEDMVKEDSIIIDVGTNKEGDKVYGDVDPAVDEVAGFRSPVPGGVGPMTVAMLMKNVVELYKLKK